ncbi:RNA-directed DNA polymerase, eukaryota [Tanacetum coccineum]|uniref:RNA-directed DNA polymerase, eukaryota n=1 Tax=Tanacetum coccineum TaxID=301880 RepID=A0ABQ4WFI6_9ASTR
MKMEILLDPTSNKLMVGDLCDSLRIKLVTTGKKRWCDSIRIKLVLVTHWFTLIVLSALRRSDNENMLSRSLRIRRILKDGGEVRGGSESSQLSLLQEYIEGTILSSLEDRWVWDLNGEGVFCVKDVRNLLDDVFLPKSPIATRWIKYVPIKLNVFAWKVHLNRLPTRVNLQHRGVLVSDPSCPICHSEDEDLAHLFFRCSLVTDIVRLVCRWWNIAWASIDSYSNWLHWFNAIRLSPKVKDLLEGVFYITWWSIWRFRNQVLFSSLVPRKDVLFDDIVSRSFTWCRSRCKSNFSWVSWLQHPYLISL